MSTLYFNDKVVLCVHARLSVGLPITEQYGMGLHPPHLCLALPVQTILSIVCIFIQSVICSIRRFWLTTSKFITFMNYILFQRKKNQPVLCHGTMERNARIPIGSIILCDGCGMTLRYNMDKMTVQEYKIPSGEEKCDVVCRNCDLIIPKEMKCKICDTLISRDTCICSCERNFLMDGEHKTERVSYFCRFDCQRAYEKLIIKNGRSLGKNFNHTCAQCGRIMPSMKKCGNCRMDRYCSDQCVRKHWPKHKSLCKERVAIDRSRRAKKMCHYCEKEASSGFKKCSRCLGVRYCSEACQRAHWPTHKPICNKYTRLNRADKKKE